MTKMPEEIFVEGTIINDWHHACRNENMILNPVKYTNTAALIEKLEGRKFDVEPYRYLTKEERAHNAAIDEIIKELDSLEE